MFWKYYKKNSGLSIVKFYLNLQHFLKFKTVIDKKEEFVNVSTMKDVLKTKKDIFYGVRSIEESVEYIFQNKAMEVVVDCREMQRILARSADYSVFDV